MVKDSITAIHFDQMTTKRDTTFIDVDTPPPRSPTALFLSEHESHLDDVPSLHDYVADRPHEFHIDPRDIGHIIVLWSDLRDMNTETDTTFCDSADDGPNCPNVTRCCLWKQVNTLTVSSFNACGQSIACGFIEYTDEPHNFVRWVDDGISNIVHLRNILHLDLTDSHIQLDLTPTQLNHVGQMTQLETLLIASSADDMGPLCGLVNLRRFGNLSNKMKTFSPLGEHLTNLEVVEFWDPAAGCASYGMYDSGRCPTFGDLSNLKTLKRFIWNGTMFFSGKYYHGDHHSFQPWKALLDLPSTVQLSVVFMRYNSYAGPIGCSTREADCELLFDLIKHFGLRFKSHPNNGRDVYTYRPPALDTGDFDLRDQTQAEYDSDLKVFVRDLFGYGYDMHYESHSRKRVKVCSE